MWNIKFALSLILVLLLLFMDIEYTAVRFDRVGKLLHTVGDLRLTPRSRREQRSSGLLLNE